MVTSTVGCSDRRRPALDRDGDASASAALVIDPHEPMAAFRLRISPLLEVTEVRWRLDVPAQVENVRDVTLLTGESKEPDEPVALDGTLLHFVQETDGRLFADDVYEPWVTIALPRTVAARERFIELSYEGPLLDDVRDSNNHLLKDTVYWMPRHPDNRRTRMSLTYRVPSRFRIASGTDLVDEHVADATRNHALGLRRPRPKHVVQLRSARGEPDRASRRPQDRDLRR